MSLKLPIDRYIEEILAKLGSNQNLVLVASPGAGKTTRLPPALLRFGGGRVLVLEPRRVAAVAAADRVALENGWLLGEDVGYQVRFENKANQNTRLIYMTEALLARRLLTDPELKEVDVVVLDEFHERSSHVDLALGLLRELQELGSNIKIVVMSATLEAEKLAKYLGDAPIIRVPGALFPLETIHLEKTLAPRLDYNFISEVMRKIQSVAPKSLRDILVFLPGVGEIERVKENLLEWAAREKIELVTLHGSLNLDEQRRVLKAADPQAKRIILSTNVAESSLTIDGVTTVIDTGLAKTLRQDFATGFSRLELGRISLSSAVQRAGRAARQAPGTCYRLWTKFDEGTMKKDETPEILRIDLAESLLYLAAQGVSDIKNFMWFETPPLVAIESAVRELQVLNALDAKGVITPHGRKLIELPLTPLWANFLILAWQNGQFEMSCLAVSLLQERDILKNSDDQNISHYENDLLLRIEILQEFARGKRPQNIKPYIAKSALKSAEQIAHIFKRFPKTAQGALTFDEVVLLAFKHKLCRRRGKTDKAKMVGGRGVQLTQESSVKTAEFFITLQAMDTSTSSDTRVRVAYGLDRDLVMNTLKNEIIEHEDLYFDESKGQFFSRKVKMFLDLELEDDRLSPAPATQSEDQLAQFLAKNIDYVRAKNEDLDNWLKRWGVFAAAKAESLNLTPNHFKQAFEMACLGCRRVSEVLDKNLIQYFEGQFKSAQIAEFNREAPAHFLAPTGSKLKISYFSDKPPCVEVRLQEIFGVLKNPLLLGGKVPLQFHLLGPNYRPVQVTSDLTSFWQNTYPEVRKELRSRYPKHSWPENPLIADPVRRGRSVKN